MYKPGDVIGGRYSVVGVCSNAGGMGTVLDVKPLAGNYPQRIVLKYCKAMDDNSKLRFKREVRYLIGFAGNSRVAQIVDSDLDVDPPYFVMSYYSGGDLSGLARSIRGDDKSQEVLFNKMLDCISELHAAGFQHRDIKPQNFLCEGENVVVSDLGLAKEIDAGTTFTRNSESFGTYGYMPPEYFADGRFKDATPQSDIFMLGKTFYSLLTGHDPFYLSAAGLHPALFSVIERCCETRPENRYASIAQLRQDLTLAYDVILGRGSGLTSARQALSQIVGTLTNERKYDVQEISTFLDLLAKLQDDERASLLNELPNDFFHVLAQDSTESKLGKFLEQYEVFVHEAVNTWSYAETVANNMRVIFDLCSNMRHRAKALEIAIEGAIWANRFTAMDTCKRMITGVNDHALGVAVAAVINKYRDSFIAGIEPVQCQNDVVCNAVTFARTSGASPSS